MSSFGGNYLKALRRTPRTNAVLVAPTQVEYIMQVLLRTCWQVGVVGKARLARAETKSHTCTDTAIVALVGLPKAAFGGVKCGNLHSGFLHFQGWKPRRRRSVTTV